MLSTHLFYVNAEKNNLMRPSGNVRGTFCVCFTAVSSPLPFQFFILMREEYNTVTVHHLMSLLAVLIRSVNDIFIFLALSKSKLNVGPTFDAAVGSIFRLFIICSFSNAFSEIYSSIHSGFYRWIFYIIYPFMYNLFYT